MLSPKLNLSPPKPKKVLHETSIHGEVLQDFYHWMRDRDNPEVIEHLKAENAYTDQMMANTEELQKNLYDEMLARIKETDLSVPSKLDDYYYYSRTEKGKQYSIQCRKKKSLEAPEEVILDLNAMAEGKAYFDLGSLRISPDHHFLAYSTDTTGDEVYTLYVKDLETGKLLSDKIEKTYASVEWSKDQKYLFYTTLDATKRPYRLYRHEIGQDASKDILVYEEKDEAYFLGFSKTQDREYFILDLGSKTTSEVHFLKTEDPLASFQLIHPRESKLEYSVEHHKGRFLIVTNDQAVNFKLVEAPVSSPGKENWKEKIPAREGIKIEGIDVFEKYFVIYEREQGLIKICVEEVASGETHTIDFPEPVYTAGGGNNLEFKTETLRFDYASLVTPASVYDYDLKKRTRELKKQQKVLGGYDPTQYACERLWATSHDGTKVPISIVYKKDFSKNGKAPLFLYGYGAYGITIDPIFSSMRLSLLNRGFAFAIAHIRGGGYLGRPWYEDGKFFNKPNSFHDFIACAEHLIQEQYTSKENLAIYGGSAGGLLMGAVTNMRPDLFKTVIAKVPFVDVVNTMLDDSLPLTVTEYDEWGNPKEKDYFDAIRAYSPYNHVEAKNYPSMLITGGLHDPRVQYWEPAKWTAKLRELKSGENPILLRMEMEAGHGGPTGRYEILKEIAFDYAFVLSCLNRA